jgi:iron(III) transport system substrate-binding protein
MRTFRALALAAVLLGMSGATAAMAQDAPVLKAASPEEKGRLAPLIDAAKKEGAVTYWDAVVQPQTNDALAAAFRKRYGLPSSFQVNYSLSTTAALVTRVEQEIGAGRVTIDIVAIASLPWVYERVAAGEAMEYDSPEYGAFKKSFDQGLGIPKFAAFNGAYLFVPMWDPDKLNFKGKSWKDVVGAVPEGRVTVGDVSKSVAYLATYAGLRSVMGPDYFKQVAAMKPSFLVRSEQIAGRVVSGEDLMALSGMPTRAYQYNEKGASLKFILPEEGVVLLPQSMFILAKAPHPNAAKLWVDFILSEEGQAIIVKGEAMISGREGFKSPLPEYAPPIDSLKLIPVDWKKLSTDELKKIRAEWTAIFNP